MTREQIVRMYAECRALCLHSEPLNDLELARYRTDVARETARAIERRRPVPQLPLEAVA